MNRKQLEQPSQGRKPLKRKMVIPVWTEEDISRIIRLYTQENIDISNIAKQMGTSYLNIRNLIFEKGFLKLKACVKMFSKEREKEMIDLYRDGWGIEALSKKFECSYDTVKAYVINNGLSLRKYKKYPITQEQEEDIVSRYKSGETLAQIASAHKISMSPVIKILDRWGIERRVYRGKTSKLGVWSEEAILPLSSYANRKNNAIRSGHAWEIDIKDINKIYKAQNGRCYYTELPMKIANCDSDYRKIVKNSPYAVSIDRKDSSLGYSLENIVLCCRFVNLAKNNFPEEEFKRALQEAAKLIVARHEPPCFNPWSFGC